MIYDDSMNLRNILWLAPQPGNRADAWESPGMIQLVQLQVVVCPSCFFDGLYDMQILFFVTNLFYGS